MTLPHPEDYYDLLAVGRGADNDELKKAYKRQALKWHPDKHDAAGRHYAEERFKRVSEAFQVLSDPQKRAAYDQRGKKPASPAFGGPARRSAPASASDRRAGSEPAAGQDRFFADWLRQAEAAHAAPRVRVVINVSGLGGGGMRDPFDFFYEVFAADPGLDSFMTDLLRPAHVQHGARQSQATHRSDDPMEEWFRQARTAQETPDFINVLFRQARAAHEVPHFNDEGDELRRVLEMSKREELRRQHEASLRQRREEEAFQKVLEESKKSSLEQRRVPVGTARNLRSAAKQNDSDSVGHRARSMGSVASAPTLPGSRPGSGSASHAASSKAADRSRNSLRGAARASFSSSPGSSASGAPPFNTESGAKRETLF